MINGLKTIALQTANSKLKTMLAEICNWTCKTYGAFEVAYRRPERKVEKRTLQGHGRAGI
jgi:hypothetical protein